MPEEIARRIEALKKTAELENDNYYGTKQDYDLDAFERDAMSVSFDGDDDEFCAEESDDPWQI